MKFEVYRDGFDEFLRRGEGYYVFFGFFVG